MKTAEEIQSVLNHCYGTEGYHRWSSLFRNHVLTDGTKLLCEMADCYWLMDAIASYHKSAMKDEMLQDIQFWTLTVNGTEATLICERDTDNIAFKQTIPYTDFPLKEIKLYVSRADENLWVILLPSEN